MKGFHRIEEQVRVTFESLANDYGFEISISECEIKLASKNCSIIVSSDRYYPDINTVIINPQANSRNKFELGEIMRLRKVPFTASLLDREVVSDDACLIEELQITAKLLRLCCEDIMGGNFKSLENEGYWKLPKLTQQDIDFIAKYGKYPVD